MMRVVLDVNVLISAIIVARGISRRIVRAWGDGAFILISSEPIITVTTEKLRLPRIARRYRITEAQTRLFEFLIRSRSTIVPVLPSEVAPVTGDPEDDAVLTTARLGRAEYLVTGDKGLLALGTHEGVSIVTPRQFLTLLEEREAL